MINIVKNPRGFITTADVTVASSAILSAKTAPIGADSGIIIDSEAASVVKKATFANIAKAVSPTLAGVEATNGLTQSAGVLTVAAKVAHLEAALLIGHDVFPMSFEAGEVATTRIYFPMAVTIDKIRAIVTKVIADTTDGTITCGNASGASTGGVVTCTKNAPLNTNYSVTPTTNNTVAKDSYYYLTTAKGDAGGKVLVTLEWHQTATI